MFSSLYHIIIFKSRKCPYVHFFVNYILPFRLWEEIKQSRNMVLFVEKIPKTYKTYQIYSFPKLSTIFNFSQGVVKTNDASIPKVARRGRKRKVAVYLIISPHWNFWVG